MIDQTNNYGLSKAVQQLQSSLLPQLPHGAKELEDVEDKEAGSERGLKHITPDEPSGPAMP